MSWIQWPVRRDQANGAPLRFRACVPTLNRYFSFTEKYWERRNLADYKIAALRWRDVTNGPLKGGAP
jgi:hypothetical protein